VRYGHGCAGGAGVGGAHTALAVAPPDLGAMQPVRTLTGRDETSTVPVFAVQLSAALWPGVDQVAVRHGIAPTPQLRLSAAENTPDFILTNPTYESWGGTMVQSERTWATVRIFSGVTPGGPPTLQWGNVDRIVYEHPTDGYDLTVGYGYRPGRVLWLLAVLLIAVLGGINYLGVKAGGRTSTALSVLKIAPLLALAIAGLRFAPPSIVRSAAMHARRSAYGSAAPVGASPIAKQPASVSRRSARAITAATSVAATSSCAPSGL